MFGNYCIWLKSTIYIGYKSYTVGQWISDLSCTGIVNIIYKCLYWPEDYYEDVTTVYDQIMFVNPLRFLFLCSVVLSRSFIKF